MIAITEYSISLEFLDINHQTGCSAVVAYRAKIKDKLQEMYEIFNDIEYSVIAIMAEIDV